MAAPLERLDSIRDSLINRGLGGSGLTRQAIQRANLPQLQPALAESRDTRANERQSRLSKLASSGLASRAKALSQQSGRGRAGGGSINARVVRKGGGFVLQTPGSGGGKAVTNDKQFDSVFELKQFLKKNPQFNLITNPQVTPLSQAQRSQGLLEGLDSKIAKRLGARFVTQDQSRELLGVPEPTLNPPILGSRSSGTPSSPSKRLFQSLSPQTDSSGAQGQVGRDISGTRATARIAEENRRELQNQLNRVQSLFNL